MAIVVSKVMKEKLLDPVDSTVRYETLKDRATQLLIKFKSGALVTQKHVPLIVTCLHF